VSKLDDTVVLLQAVVRLQDSETRGHDSDTIQTTHHYIRFTE